MASESTSPSTHRVSESHADVASSAWRAENWEGGGGQATAKDHSTSHLSRSGTSISPSAQI